MTTAVLTNYSEITSQLPAGSDIFLRGQTWENYEEILESVGEASGLRISFDGRNVKIMTLSTKHEKYVRFIEMIITTLSLKIRKRILHFGSATIKSSCQERGSEPDCCFYVQNAELVADKDTIDFSRDVPPDIVVEIDIHHSSTEKFEIYSKLRVPEFWLYDGERLRIYQFESENYIAVKKSLALPILSDDVLTDFLNSLQTSDQFEILLKFEKWLDSQN
ncbi:Uma2 family endonuclease [soil metagenome]